MRKLAYAQPLEDKMKISRIGVITHPRVGEDLAGGIVDRLTNEEMDLFFDPVTAEKINAKKTEVKNMRIDLAVILGGDGTILWAINELSNNPLILGVNVGNLGYLTELTPDDVMEKLDLLLTGKYSVDERMKLVVDDEFEALNEALLICKEPATLLEFRIKIDDVEIAHFRADGVMAATPTGSTAYSLSAGGPILHPRTEGYLITPVNPFQRKQYPVVVPEGSETTVELVREDREANLIMDGRVVKRIRANQRISIRKAEHAARFVRFSDDFNYRLINTER